ncbi:MAG: hypothetical protein A2Y73_05770 [Chloroflexi bacterium RBG_13_56_8]|nr:MAG: hypothetical protein A2Y73_05770 [Chloroflexi bacterium RBG_13_56_8]
MIQPGGASGDLTTARPWRSALFHAVPLTALILYLLYHWFAIADRYIVFLYYHDMGPLYPDTSPFSAVTSSRYWMAGLVASGAAMMLYTFENWLLGRIIRSYRPPTWWRVWALCAVPLVIGIPSITMNVNQPTLPLSNALQVTCTTLIGLALATLPGKVAASQPNKLLPLAVDGWGMMLVMLSLVGVELLSRRRSNGGIWWVQIMALGIVGGGALLLATTALHVWRGWPALSARSVFLAGACEAYLLMPLLHHVSFSNRYYYITDKDNFFASRIGVQLIIWLIAAGLAWGITRLRPRLVTRFRANVT